MIIFNKDIKLRLGGLENSYGKLRDELKDEIDSLRKLSDARYEEIGKLNAKIRELERINKYAKDGEIVYVLEVEHNFDHGMWASAVCRDLALYIYVNRREYKFYLNELSCDQVYIQYGQIRKDKNGLIYLSLKASDSELIHDLIIDINTDKYVHAISKS